MAEAKYINANFDRRPKPNSSIAVVNTAKELAE